MLDKTTSIQELKDTLMQFIAERNWQKYHSPKNISMSIAIEAAELMEKFQFATIEDSYKEVEKNKQEIEHELADILAYVISFAHVCNIDLSKAFLEKIKLNEKKYPAEKVTGSFENYRQLRNTFKKQR